ncbi:MAG: hypothetical protein ACERKZ_02200 [Lachnotalea sp.]
MESTVLKSLMKENDIFNIRTESFICEGALYNATYIPNNEVSQENEILSNISLHEDEIPQQVEIMLEKVIKYPSENFYYKNKINMIIVTVIKSTEIKLSSFTENINCEQYEIALAAATAAYKFDLVKNYLTVNMKAGIVPIHINSCNR